ncbi:AraC family transcriptional regulator [Oceanobacillus halophilus]|uniref:AraC family transcriptional regulator n=1 Tax=Oceanobacillus halophilus TaxID=930130 RepID=A0A495A4Y2_9BACI|nr:AraC family transcriptional regulator [Oceanobacillus halophilus]RKQ34329.1 AraC family transcriptional regulator [Oceanobacillus halophilus]
MEHNGQTPSSYKLFVTTHQKGVHRNIDIHTHFHYELFIFHSGTCNYLIDNKVYPLVSGDIILMDGSKLHKPSIQGDPSLYDRSIIQFSIDWLAPLLQFLDSYHLVEPFERNHYSIYRTNNTGIDEVIQLMKRMEKLLLSQNFFDVEMQLKIELVDLLFTIQRFQNKKLTEFENLENDKSAYIQQIATFVQEHFKEKITLDDIADQINLSKSYLVHLFKEQTGYTIMDYLMQYRFTQSLHLLKTYPDWTFKELCQACGFKSEAHFSRFFKERVGVTPREYRKYLG